MENNGAIAMPGDASHWLGRVRRMAAVALGLYVLGWLLARWFRLEILLPSGATIYFLDPLLLRERLGESLIYLHGQPPMLNLILGLGLKLESAFGVPLAHSMTALHLALGAVAAAGVGATAALMLPGRWRPALVSALVLLHPVFWSQLYNFFYVLHEMAILLAMSAILGLWLTRRRGVAAPAAVASLAVVMCYTRSLFHFAWALAIFGGLYRLAPLSRRRRLAGVLALATLLLLAWPAKNKWIFGFFGYSSWQGYSFSRSLVWHLDTLMPHVDGLYDEQSMNGVPLHWTDRDAELGLLPRKGRMRVAYWVGHPDISPERPVSVTLALDGRVLAEDRFTSPTFRVRELDPAAAGGKPLRFGLTVNRTWTSPDRRQLGVGLFPIGWITTSGLERAELAPLAEVYRGVPEHLRHVPALTRPVHPTDVMTNGNHYLIIEDSRRRVRLACENLVANPLLILNKAAFQYLCATLFEGFNVYNGGYAQVPYWTERPALRPWMRLFEVMLCQDFRNHDELICSRIADHGYWPPSGLMLTLPLILIGAAWRIRRDWRRDPLRTRLALFMLFNILWVLAMVLLVDGIEGNRIRFSTLPYMLILACWILPAAKESQEAQVISTAAQEGCRSPGSMI